MLPNYQTFKENSDWIWLFDFYSDDVTAHTSMGLHVPHHIKACGQEKVVFGPENARVLVAF